MKKDLMNIICCPVCKGDLKLTVNREAGNEVVEGTLFCGKCDFPYKISDGIPNLLPPDMQ